MNPLAVKPQKKVIERHFLKQYNLDNKKLIITPTPNGNQKKKEKFPDISLT